MMTLATRPLSAKPVFRPADPRVCGSKHRVSVALMQLAFRRVLSIHNSSRSEVLQVRLHALEMLPQIIIFRPSCRVSSLQLATNLHKDIGGVLARDENILGSRLVDHPTRHRNPWLALTDPPPLLTRRSASAGLH